MVARRSLFLNLRKVSFLVGCVLILLIGVLVTSYVGWRIFPRPDGSFHYTLFTELAAEFNSDNNTAVVTLSRLYDQEVDHVCVFAGGASHHRAVDERVVEAAEIVSQRTMGAWDSDYHYVFVQFLDGSTVVDRTHFLSTSWRLDPYMGQAFCGASETVEVEIFRNENAGPAGGGFYFVSYELGTDNVERGSD